MNQIRIVIVDDEKRIRTTLKNVLALYCPNTIVVAEAESVASAFDIISKSNPDVVLLDIKMTDGTGFDLLKKFSHPPFKVIFITAFDQYAIQAFKFSALDYLLKPVIPDDLVSALQRAELEINTEVQNEKMRVLINNKENLTRETKKILLNSQNKITVVNVCEIIRCEADRNYTLFILQNNKSVLVSRSLKEYEEILVPFGFFRSHHSHLVNLYFVERLEKRDGGILIMKDGSEVLVSSRKYGELITALNSM